MKVIDLSCSYLVSLFLENDIDFLSDCQETIRHIQQFPQDQLYHHFVRNEIHTFDLSRSQAGASALLGSVYPRAKALVYNDLVDALFGSHTTLSQNGIKHRL